MVSYIWYLVTIHHKNRLQVACKCSPCTDRQTDWRQRDARNERYVAMPSKSGILPTQRIVRNHRFPLCITYFKHLKESLSSLATEREDGNEPDLRSTRHSSLTHPSRNRTFCLLRLRSERFKVRSHCGT
jgi:hypothetical protein